MKFRLFKSVGENAILVGEGDKRFICLLWKLIALSGQTEIQLKQSTQRLTSMDLFLTSIHNDLHSAAHFPQEVHFESSNLILKMENFERKPKKVPTGQMVLHHSLPFFNDMIMSVPKTNNGKTKPTT
jgi:hypothetical protein